MEPERRRQRLGVASMLALAVSCRPPEDTDVHIRTREREARATTIAMEACVLPAKRRACEPTFRMTFEGSPHTIVIEDPNPPPGESGELWCEDGTPRGRFERIADGKSIDGVFGEAVWEALERLLAATGSCVLAFGRPAVVWKNGNKQTCSHAEHDATSLVNHAYWWSRQRHPVLMKRKPPCTIGLCTVCTDECRREDPNARGPRCPRYEGDDLAEQ